MFMPPSVQQTPYSVAPGRARVPWGWLDLLAIALVAAALYVAEILAARLLVSSPAHLGLAALGRSFVSRGVSPHVIQLVVGSLLLYGAAALAIVSWLRGIRRYEISWATFGYHPAPLSRLAAVAFGIYPATILTSAVVTALTVAFVQKVLRGHFSNPQTQAIFGGVRPTVPNIALLLLLVAVLAPLVEETLFRGVLYQLLRNKLPVSVAAVVSAAIFAAAHAIPIIFPVLFITGVALALTFEYCHSIYGSALLHGLVNGVNILLLAHTLAPG